MKKLGDESGQTLAFVALAMSVLLGFAAIATDIGVMLHEQNLLQTAADSAAIATAKAISSDEADSAAKTAGENDAALNGFTNNATDSNDNIVTTVTISTTPTDGHFEGKTGYVEAVITQQTPTFFMRLFSRDSMTIKARAVATYIGTGTACGWSLHHNSSGVSGNPWGNSTINSPGCGWLFNGNLVLGASDSVIAGYVAATGTISGPQHINGMYENGISSFTDPLERLSNPNNLPAVSGTTCTSPANSDGTAGPSCYLNQPLSGTLQPGVYYYTKPSAATYTGAVDGSAGVTIILTNGSLLSTTGGSGKGNASLNLTSPSSGPFSGVVLDAPTYSGELDLDFGATGVTFTGAVYAPNADLSLQDQGSSLTVNGDLVIGTLDVGNKNKGNLNLNNLPSSIPSPIPRISLVE
jgi:Flp pilus assembly protein TadG